MAFSANQKGGKGIKDLMSIQFVKGSGQDASSTYPGANTSKPVGKGAGLCSTKASTKGSTNLYGKDVPPERVAPAEPVLFKEEYANLMKGEKDPMLKRFRKLAFEVVNLRTPRPNATDKINSAANRVPMKVEFFIEPVCAGKPGSNFVCHVSMEGIRLGSAEGAKMKDAKANAYELALQKVFMPHLRIVQLDPQTLGLQGSKEAFTSPPPEPSKVPINKQVNKTDVRQIKESNLQEAGIKRRYNEFRPLEEFVIVEPLHSVQDCTPAHTLRRSADFNHMLLEHEYFFKGENLVRCVLKIENQVLADVPSNSKVAAKNYASICALSKLKEICWVIKTKQATDADMGDRISKEEIFNELTEETDTSTIDPNSVGSKLMKKMGWSGGGMGKDGSGIEEPVSLNSVMNREGLGLTTTKGVTEEFRRRVKEVIEAYASSDNPEDLVFNHDFSLEERQVIHNECRRLHLKSKSRGKGKARYLCVRRKRTANELFQHLMDCGGETHRYKLIPPGQDKNTSYEDKNPDTGFPSGSSNVGPQNQSAMGTGNMGNGFSRSGVPNMYGNGGMGGQNMGNGMGGQNLRNGINSRGQNFSNTISGVGAPNFQGNHRNMSNKNNYPYPQQNMGNNSSGSGPLNMSNNFSGPQNWGNNISGPQNWGNNFSGPQNMGNNFSGPQNMGNNFSGPQNMGNNFSGPQNVGNNFSGQQNMDNNFYKPQNGGNNFKGSQNTGINFTGQQNTGNNTSGQQNMSNNYPGPQHKGNNFSGPQNMGNNFSGPQNIGNNLSGPQNMGNNFSGPQNMGNKFSGPQSMGNNFSGPQKEANNFSGPQNTGNKYSGAQNMGNLTSGPRNMGDNFSCPQNIANNYGNNFSGPASDYGNSYTGPQNMSCNSSIAQNMSGSFPNAQNMGGDSSGPQYMGGNFSGQPYMDENYSSQQYMGGNFSGSGNFSGQQSIGNNFQDQQQYMDNYYTSTYDYTNSYSGLQATGGNFAGSQTMGSYQNYQQQGNDNIGSWGGTSGANISNNFNGLGQLNMGNNPSVASGMSSDPVNGQSQGKDSGQPSGLKQKDGKMIKPGKDKKATGGSKKKNAQHLDKVH